jgi:hypothetical protein
MALQEQEIVYDRGSKTDSEQYLSQETSRIQISPGTTFRPQAGVFVPGDNAHVDE